MRCEALLDALHGRLGPCLPETILPEAVARWVIDHEWVQTLDDLIERRLGLMFTLFVVILAAGFLAVRAL